MYKIITTVFCLLFALHSYASTSCMGNTTFNIGKGIKDITGPAAEQGMMGYGMLAQQTAGIYQRLWARAFIIESPCNQKRVVIVNADLGQIFQGIKQQVIKKLKTKFGDLYSEKNVLLTATHTHSGPGGYSTYLFYNLTTLGFSRDNFNAIIDGIVSAIEQAHTTLVPATIKMAQGELSGISHNRSPTAYLENPSQERARYMRDYDATMTLLRFDNTTGAPLGMMNWFPLHGVSMNNKNHLINGDNKGFAEYLFEKDFSTDFIAAFLQGSAGDISPNALGHEGGSDAAGIAAVEKAGRAQYQKAKELYVQANTQLTGGVDFRHMYIAMGEVIIDPKYTDGNVQVTCPAAIGVSMLAGTQDGEGVGKQGITCATISKVIPKFICELRTTACQGVKPIALSTGSMKPYPWTPNVLPFQVFKIGQLVIAAVPFEITTMSGRRIKDSLAEKFGDVTIVLTTLANAYSGYVATPQEYQLQRYEGASTHFGPWTLAAIQQTLAKLAEAITSDKEVPPGQEPRDLSKFQLNLQPGVVFDSVPLTKHFGDLYLDTRPAYMPGETVEVTFWGGHPKNNYRNGSTFLTVEQYKEGSWVKIRTDNDWDTEYHWQRKGLSESLITIRWRVPHDIEKGLYRIVHFGDSKTIFGQITNYTGYSRVFKVI